MKNYLYLLACVIFIFSTSCHSAHLITLDNGKKIDPRIVGSWTGSETDKQFEGTTKTWEMTRLDAGTFILNFEVDKNGEYQSWQETGIWWIEKGKFYEHHNESNLTDIYTYKVLNKNQVHFKAEKISLEMNTDSYEFTDTRKVSNQTTQANNYENAIKVNDVSEEYHFVKKNCRGCKVKKQSLVHHKGTPYDILTVEKPDGTQVQYFFNIKSFFGKFLN